MGQWLLKYVVARLGEPSTWRGIIALLTAFGIAIRPQMAEAITALGLALFGAVGVAAPDRIGSKPVSGVRPVVSSSGAPSDYSTSGDAGRTGREDLERWER